MRVWHAAAGLAATVMLLPALGSAQSLGDAAAKEKEKRKGKTAKPYTEADLRKAGSGGTLSMTGDSSEGAPAPTDTAAGEGQGATPPEGQAKAPGQGQKSEEQLRSEAQDAWRKKLDKARTDADALREQVNLIQTDLNDSSTSYYGSRRTNLMTLLDQTKQKVAAKEQEITQLEEEGRRNSYK
jgi:hypothetical protein